MAKKRKTLEERFSLDDIILGTDFEGAFFDEPEQPKLKPSNMIGEIASKNRAFKKANRRRRMFPLPVSDIAGDVVKLAPYQVIPEAMKKASKGEFVMVKTKIGKNKKTRIT